MSIKILRPSEVRCYLFVSEIRLIGAFGTSSAEVQRDVIVNYSDVSTLAEGGAKILMRTNNVQQ